MKNSIVTSMEKVVILESRGEKYLESALIGLQLGVLFFPLAIVREVLYPFFSGLYYIGLVVYGAVEDVFKGCINFLSHIGLSFYYGFLGRLAIKN